MSWYDDSGVLRPGRPPGSRNLVSRVLPKRDFGLWRVLRREGNRSTNGEALYACRCACGVERIVSAYHLQKGLSKSCGCSPVKGSAHCQWTGLGDISGRYWDQIRRGATRAKGRRYDVEFSITIEYAWRLFLRQKRKCALTGWPLTMSYGRARHTASLDRIDSKKGYVRGNVQWVHKEINMMKNKMPLVRFLGLCTAVTTHAVGGCER